MVKVKMPDGITNEYPKNITIKEILSDIDRKIAKKAIGAKLNETIVDLSEQIKVEGEVTLDIITSNSGDSVALDLMRHSAAHVMAEAICRLWPETKLVYGPTIENGFYYDIDLDHQITEDEFKLIEKEMQKIVKRDMPFRRVEMARDEGLNKLTTESNHYKIDNAKRAIGDVLSFYYTGDNENAFEDLCKGPHVPSTRKIGSFKVLSISGAYWRGDASQKMLQRVYGTSWPTKENLDEYIKRLDEAKKRDHRFLNKRLEIFDLDDEIGAGLIIWHPKGGMIRHLIESFWKDEHIKRQYDIVYTPHIASEKIYQTSGHIENYADSMYSPMVIDNVNYYVKPMNCPAHVKIYKSKLHSYRDLPIRLCELSTVYRYELSGSLHGLLRVRGFTQDDSHIFCTIKQLPEEISGVIDLVDTMMTKFGYTYKVFLATRPEKSIGTDEEWDWATEALKEALKNRGINYEIDEGGGVFYAPKIDFKLEDSIGRYWQGPTVQVDLHLPKRFNIKYIGSDNNEHQVVMIHRTVLGSMERFVGGLIEHYGGSFPLWLAPTQIRIVSISEKHIDYANSILPPLQKAGFRVEVDNSDEKLGSKIRKAHMNFIPYMIIVGKKEEELKTVNVRKPRN